MIEKRLDRFQEAEVFTDAQGNYISKSRNNKEVAEVENIRNVSDTRGKKTKQKMVIYTYSTLSFYKVIIDVKYYLIMIIKMVIRGLS